MKDPRPPAVVSRFLGRDTEIAELAQIIPRVRLLTLTGPPGIGKTRLAIEMAGVPDRRRRTGAALVELAPIAQADPALVWRAVASALAVADVPGQSLDIAVAEHVRRRSRPLLVLDNCEHVLDGCATVAAGLLASCPELRILATSRERLSIGEERVWPVPPLSVPDPDEAEPTDETLLEYGAVRLFVERAAAAAPGFSLNSYVAPAVIEICRRLDGIPLALELAAARVESLTPAEIVDRLDDRFSLLRDGGAAAARRHRTLLTALDWSHELLPPAERALLRRLSVFSGGFGLESAQAVCAGGGVQAGETADLLARLVSRSLLVADTASSGRPSRYTLLETVRAYAADRLEDAGETATLRETHARVHLALAELAEPHLTGPDQRTWLEHLESEHDNLRLALEWCLSHGRAQWALRLAGALVLFWRVRCHFREGRDLLAAAVSAGDGEAPAPRAKALWGAGFLAFMAGDTDAAVPPLEESLSHYRALDDRQGCARALLVLGNCRQLLNDPAARSLLAESATMAREADDAWCLAHALACAGFDHAAVGDLPCARRLFEECVAVSRAQRDDQSLRAGLLGLGAVVLHQGDYGRAKSLLEEAVAVAGALGEGYSRATALRYLAELAFGRGEYARAREVLDRATDLLHEIAPSKADLDALMLLGRVAHAQGDRAGARLRFEDGLARSGPDPPAHALLCLGELTADEGRRSEAQRLFEQARRLARARDDNGSLGWAVHALGRLARTAGDLRQAATLHGKALRLQRRVGDLPGIATSLEAIAGVAATDGRGEHAARLIGAARALRQTGGYTRHPWEAARYDADLAIARRGLSAEEFELARTSGAALSIAQAVALASRGNGRRTRFTDGWPSLTEPERRVAELVAEGLTNRMVAERLFVSLGTVKSHLTHIFAKLGVARRSELAGEVWRRRQEAAAGDCQ